MKKRVVRITESQLDRVIINESLMGGVVGSTWKSCGYWRDGNNTKYKNMFTFTKTTSLIEVEYSGPKSGIPIAHADNGGDTIHQVFNVLICEMNPYLSTITSMPDIDNISFETGKEGDNYKLKITIPLIYSEVPYQLNRRGGWGHTSGKSVMENNCKNKIGCYGPVTHEVKGPFGKITEHFITHPI